MRLWAFWRRIIYGAAAATTIISVTAGIYFLYGYKAPTCFDASQNGTERAIDCGGSCARICSFDVMQPTIRWVRAFKVSEGLYNAVAYVENKNFNVGAPNLHYTISLYDNEGLITEKKNVTMLPPNNVYPIFEGRIETGSRVPTQAFIEFEKETLWLPAVSSKEQFNVVQRELKYADTLPKLTATLNNTMLDEAKDVEVVATIFDSQGTALTASRTVVPYFAGRKTADVVFTWQEPISKTVRSCEVPTDVILAIDLSGSMNSDGETPPEPVSSVLKAAESFISRLKEHDQASVVSYATNARMQKELTNDHKTLGKIVAGLEIAQSDETGSTNTGDAILLAKAEFASARHNPDARKVLVLLTDGLANAPDSNPEQYALDAATALKKTGVQIFTIGLGANVNETFLTSIASENRYSRAPEKTWIDKVYQSITSALCEDGPAVIEIIPKIAASFAPLQ